MTRWRAVGTALFAALLVLGSAVAPAVAADDGFGPGSDDGFDSESDDGFGPGSADVETADTVYVTDDGDAILVYEGTGTETDGEWEYGASVAENLVYGRFTDSVDGEPDVTGDLSMTAEPTSLSADGSLSMPRPDDLETFDLTATSEATAENARGDYDLTVRLVNASGLVRLVDSVTTEGEVTMGPDRFQASGDVSVQTVLPIDQRSRMAMSLAETEDAYTLTVEREERIDAESVDQWRNRSAARATIAGQTGANESDDGDVSVGIDEYELTEQGENGARLAISYTVTYHDVEETLVDQLADAFSMSTATTQYDTAAVAPPGSATPSATAVETNAPNGSSTAVNATDSAGLDEDEWDRPSAGADAAESGISEEDAQTLAEELLASDIDEASFEFSAEGGTYSGNFALDVGNYDGFLQAYYETLENADGATMGPAFDQARNQFEAQQAADLQQHYTWTGDLTPSDDAATLNLSVEHRTDNWDAYVSELRDRDVPFHESEFELNGNADGDQLTVDGSMSMTGDRLYEAMFSGFGGDEVEESMSAGLDSLSAAQPQQLKLDAAYDADGARVETAGKFGNLAVLRDELADDNESAPVGNVTEVTSRVEGDTVRTAIRLGGVVAEDAATEDVRAIEDVTNETEVHMPGEWSEDDVPAMDIQQASAFLAGQSGGVIGPGFGVAAALVAVLGAALLAARRR